MNNPKLLIILCARSAAIANRLGMNDDAILTAANETAKAYKQGCSDASAIDAGLKKAKQLNKGKQ